MKPKEFIKILSPYCDKIVHNKKHYKAYVKGTDKVITISSSSSDQNFMSMVFRDFRRLGIIIKELKK